MDFFQQYFYQNNKDYSVVIEDNGIVAYAYLLKNESIISDVWLYNQSKTPDVINWKEKQNMPFLNPTDFVSRNIEPLQYKDEISIDWTVNREIIEARINVRKELIAILKNNAKPGWSLLVKKDGPLAKKY